MLHDLIIGQADEQLHPPINEGAHEQPAAHPSTRLIS